MTGELPERDATPADFDAVESHAELIQRSRVYCERAIAKYDVAVDLALVDWEVSTRAKRRAAAVKRPRLSGATVGDPFDWVAAAREVGAAATESGVSGANEPPVEDALAKLRRCTMSLTWTAFREFTPAEWTSTLRHELVHVEQFQRFGTTDHGPLFRRRAEELDASVRCRRFAAPKYVLRCGRCDDLVARRYRACKLVREPERYVSGCCEAPLRCERPNAE